MGFVRLSNFAFPPSMPVATVGFPLPTPSPSSTDRQPKPDASPRNARNPARGFSAADLRHNFVIKALEKPGIFKRRPYVYICLRCRYTFLVNERRGSIVALDRKAKPITEPENSKRLATFAQGPCPAFEPVAQRRNRKTIELSKPRPRLPPSGILARLALIVSGMRYPYFKESNIEPPAGILPQDLLP